MESCALCGVMVGDALLHARYHMREERVVRLWSELGSVPNVVVSEQYCPHCGEHIAHIDGRDELKSWMQVHRCPNARPIDNRLSYGQLVERLEA